MEIKDRIRKVRNAARLSQEELAARLECSLVYVTQLESGVRTGSLAFHLGLREELGVNPTWWETGKGAILIGKNEKPPPTENKEKVLRVRMTLGLSQEKLALILGYTQAAISQIEGGRWPASVKFICILMQTLEIDPIWWETGEGTMFGEKAHPQVLEHVRHFHNATGKL